MCYTQSNVGSIALAAGDFLAVEVYVDTLQIVNGAETRWEEQNRKWWENQHAIEKKLKSIHANMQWDLYDEQPFRNAMKGILEDAFHVQVVNVIEYDDSGEVFGQPDQVELDMIVKDGLLILCEIKSSMSKADMITFGRKVKFYEKKHNRQASRLLVISPMVDRPAQTIASKLGVQVYSYAEEVDPAILT